MKIKIKVKHLVISLTAFIALFFMTQMYISPLINGLIVNHQVKKGQLEQAKERILSQLNSSGVNKLSLIEEYMISPQPLGERFDVYIGPAMSSHSIDVKNRIFTIEESIPYLHVYVSEGPVQWSLNRAVQILHAHYVSESDLKKAEEVLVEGLKRFPRNNYHYYDLSLYQVESLLHSNQLADAKLLLEELEEKIDKQAIDFNLRISQLKGRLFIQNKEFALAKSFLEEVIANNKQWHDELIGDEADIEDISGSPYYRGLEHLLKEVDFMLGSAADLGIVKGKVLRSNGDPIGNVGVFLRDEKYVRMSVNEFEKHQTMTRSDGSFEFIGVIPADYQLHLGFTFEQIDGWAWTVEMDDWVEVKSGAVVEIPVMITPLIETVRPANYETISKDIVTFEWMPFPKAASYTLYGGVHFDGGSLSFQILGGIKEEKVSISVDQLYGVPIGIYFSGDDYQQVNPESFFGFANPEGTFSWSVRAFDENGTFIGQSNGYRLQQETMGSIPFFHLKSREFSAADQMLKKGETFTAIEMYKKNVEENKDDLHSIRMLIKLIGHNRDLTTEEEALQYRLLLAKKTSSSDNLFNIAESYYKARNWGEFHIWFERYRLSLNGDFNVYSESIFATALMKQERLAEAREHFHKVLKKDKSHRFVGFLLAVELILQDNWDEVEELAIVYNDRMSPSPKWLEGIKALNGHVEKDVLSKALQYFFREEEEKLEQFLKQQNQQPLSDFFEMLKRVG